MMEVKPMGQWSWDDMMERVLWVNMTDNLLKVKLMETDLKEQTFFSLRIHPFFHKHQKVSEKKIENQIQPLTFFLLIFPYFFSFSKPKQPF